MPSLGVKAILRSPVHHSLCIDMPKRTRITAKIMKVERYARINIPIMKDVYEVLEPVIAKVSRTTFEEVVAIGLEWFGPAKRYIP